MTHGWHGRGLSQRKAWLFASICTFAVLAGCVATNPAAPAVDIAPLSAQIGNLADANADLKASNARLDEANRALTAENERLKAIVRSDAQAGKMANTAGKVRFEAFVWDHLIKLLPGADDKETTDRWAAAWEAFLAGNESALQGIITDLNARSDSQSVTIGQLQRDVDNLTKERDTAAAAAESALARVKAAEATLAAAIEKARLDEAAAIRAEQVRKATQGGTVCGTLALLLAAAAIFSPAAKLRFASVAAFFLGAAFTLYAAARWLGSTWFERTVIAAWAIIGIIALVWMIRKGIEEREAKQKAARDGLVASVLVQKVNDFYNAAKPDIQAAMDAPKTGLFAILSDAGKDYAAAVKIIKAENIRNAADKTPSTPPLAETATK
jgi:hypothetical protein